jgi:hypothetical protein
VRADQASSALFSLLLCCIPAASSAREQTTVPSEYRGEWTNQQRYCGQEGDNLDSVLTVTATSVGYYENSWRVRRVEVTPNGLFLTYWPRTDFTMYAPNRLRLSRDKMRIFTSDDRAEQGTRRCPRARD